MIWCAVSLCISIGYTVSPAFISVEKSLTVPSLGFLGIDWDPFLFLIRRLSVCVVKTNIRFLLDCFNTVLSIIYEILRGCLACYDFCRSFIDS